MKPHRRKVEEVMNALGVQRAVLHMYGVTTGRRFVHARRRIRSFYAPLLHNARLVFDVGANRGHYASVFASLGSRVIALEPNPDCVRHIQICYPSVEVIQAVAGPEDGLSELNVSDTCDEMSSVSVEWIESIRACRDGQNRWNRKLTIPMLRLDTVVQHYGLPDYIKIDVEGFEEGVLDGLSYNPPLLSFEYNLAFLEAAFRCVDKLSLDRVRFNFTVGGNEKFYMTDWTSSERLKSTLAAFEHGDVYGDIFVTCRK